jgi:hypothetical protein
MGKVKCYSVRLQSLTDISEKAYKATAFDGSTAILPKSCVFDCDYDVSKSEAYWIAAWILEKKELQYSHKKEGWFNTVTKRIEPAVIVERHVPARIEPVNTNPDAALTR